MRSEILWGAPIEWDDPLPLPDGKEGEHRAVMRGPFGSFTIIFREGEWTWDPSVPKCVYGVDPCPALEARIKMMDEAVKKWLEERKGRLEN